MIGRNRVAYSRYTAHHVHNFFPQTILWRATKTDLCVAAWCRTASRPTEKWSRSSRRRNSFNSYDCHLSTGLQGYWRGKFSLNTPHTTGSSLWYPIIWTLLTSIAKGKISARANDSEIVFCPKARLVAAVLLFNCFSFKYLLYLWLYDVLSKVSQHST